MPGPEEQTGRRSGARLAAGPAAIFVATIACLSTGPAACKRTPPEPAQANTDLEVRTTRGTIKTHDPTKNLASIAHDDIPDYMKAMTMSFAVGPELMKGIAEGDRVEFTFTETKDGPLKITAMRKVP